MNWILAYINAVKTNLPRDKREDLGEELRDLLENSLQSETGRSPEEASEGEILAWLKTREHPAVLASRYHERRVLIDEESFPLFKLTLRYALAGLAVAYAVLAVVSALASGNYQPSLWDLGAGFLHSSLIAFACIVLVFHLAGKQLTARKWLASWNPKDLPNPARKWEQEPWSNSIAGLVFTGIFLLFINGVLEGVPRHFSDVEFNLVAKAAVLLPWINLVGIGFILLHTFMILKPYWSTSTLLANVLLTAGVATILYQLQSISPLLDLQFSSDRSDEQIAKLEGWVDTSLRVGLAIMLAFCFFEMVRDLWRITRLGTRRLY